MSTSDTIKCYLLVSERNKHMADVEHFNLEAITEGNLILSGVMQCTATLCATILYYRWVSKDQSNAIQETSLDNYLIIRLPNITIVAMLL